MGQFDIASGYAQFVPHFPGVYKRTLYLSTAVREACFWNTLWGVPYDTLNGSESTIGTVTVGAVVYAETASIAAVIANDESYYWDDANQTVYISYLEYDPYFMFSAARLGAIYSFANRAQLDGNGMPTDSMLGNLYLDPRLEDSGISDRQTADDLGKAEMTFDSFTFSIKNDDGAFDGIRQQVIGQGARLYYGESESTIVESDMSIIRFGTVSNVAYPNGSTMKVTVDDPRKSWKIKANDETLTKTDWPNLGDGDVDKFVPLVIGTQDRVPTVQVDTTKFLFSTETYGNVTATTVYVDGVSTSFTDNLDGTVTVSSYTTGAVSVDAVGIDEGNIAEIIIWLLEAFASIPHTSLYYNLAEVQEVIDDAQDGGIYFGTSGMDLNKAIDFLLGSINARLYPQGAVLTMRNIADRTPVYELADDEIEDLPAPWDFDLAGYFSSIRVKYRKQWDTDGFYEYFDDSDEATAVLNNAQIVPYELETGLRTLADVEVIAADRYAKGILAQRTVKIKLATSIDAELYDWIIFTHNRMGGSNITPVGIYEVVAISKISRTMSLLFIRSYTRPPTPVVRGIGFEEMFNEEMFNDGFIRGTT